MTTSGRRPAGLDLDTLRRLRVPRRDPAQLIDRISAHLDRHDGYLAFSGGKDSLAVLHLALQAEPNLPVVFFDSGLEFPETLTYLDQVAALLAIPGGIQIYPAKPTLLELLIADGSWDHLSTNTGRGVDLREVLITQPARAAHLEHGPGELWGVRATESDARRHLYRTALRRQTELNCGSCCSGPDQQRRTHGGLVERRDGTAAYSPVWDWSDDDVWTYLARHRLPLNPVYDKLRRLGAPDRALRVTSVIDGGQIRHGRAVWLRRGWPDIFAALAQALPRLSETC